ncbi:NUDIX hydrolase [Streptomyces profundus]|uniref:NUDIX hydrolase n=1 Tax=Streptomyces profundus TaxID=2867410 RepID=UPI001D167CF7|nr:NUDIX domain-containing protein [Streptomyces sp. MA3_2.13]UED84299.1 NUDIX domain-containing protein [Streptomyces sp. MA3_2.13]
MSLHEDAARVLRDWPAPDERQEELRAAYTAHLSAHPDGVWKRCAAGHITASALVVDVAAGRVLLTLHAKLGRWLQTGGHCESSDASLADAALREASEESGIAGLRLLATPVRLDRHETPCATHLDVQYAALAPADADPVISEESLALRWFDFDEAERLPDASVRALVIGARAVL